MKLQNIIAALIVLLASNFATGCGSLKDLECTQEEEQAGTCGSEVKEDTAGKVKVEGYVVSAFQMEVDGIQYEDSEDFYSQVLEGLKEKALDLGYEQYTLKFDAEVGLSDMKKGMRVYLAPDSDRGYASETRVGSDGSFKFMIPESAINEVYRMRANKRLSLILTSPNGKEQIKWCYNFSAIEQDLDLEDGRPIILNRFVTSVTEYACDLEKRGSGIVIPQ